MKKATIRIAGNVVFRRSSDEAPLVSIYGDPSGLKSLADLLYEVARIDQSIIPPKNLPEGEGFHLHLRPGKALNVESCEAIIGRLDAKGSGDFDWIFPPVTRRDKARKRKLKK